MLARALAVAGVLGLALAWSSAGAPGQGTADGGPEVLWPLGAGEEPFPIGNAYGQYQRYSTGSSPDFHDGIDLMVAPGQKVYALEAGTIAFVSGSPANPQYYEIVVESSERPGTGFHYVHLEPYGGAHFIGQKIAKDEELGETVAYDSAEGYDHLHLSLVAKRNDFDDMTEYAHPFLYTGNPLARLVNASDGFDPEVGTIRFFENESPSELSKDALSGPVDVVAQVGDRFLGDEGRLLVPYAVRLEVFRADTGVIVYRNQIVLDGQLGVNQSEVAGTLYKTDGGVEILGGYVEREFHVVTTNQPPDRDGAWEGEPGEYEVRVTVFDLSGRSGTATEEGVVVQ